MIDMHIHSTYSDGTEDLIGILKNAEKLNLNKISITDHESCLAYDELNKIDAKKYFSGEIIPGIELKARYNDIVIDILGYDINHNEMKNYVKDCYSKITREQIQQKVLEKFYEHGKRLGLVLRPIEEIKWDRKKEWGSIVFYNEMKSHEENKEKVPKDMWESFRIFKHNYYKVKGNEFYVNVSEYYPSLEEIVGIIHECGGNAFVAHIFEYAGMENQMSELKNIVQKLDGVECYHSSFTNQQIEELIEFCKENNLLMSGGSDFHGENKPNIQLGIGKGNLKVPDGILDNWKN